MTNQLPDPLVPAEVDLRDYASMMLDVVRLRDSELAGHPNGELFRANVLAWCVSWHQTPAGSLPDDDQSIARLLGYGRDLKTWKKVRDAGGLRGWIKCSDGRLYHPVVAEKAHDAWRSKMLQRWRTEVARIKKHAQRHKIDLPVPDFEDWMSQGCPQGQSLPVPKTSKDCPQGHMQGVSGETASNRSEVKGSEVNKEKSKPLSGGVPPPGTKPPPNPEAQAACKATWDAYSEAYGRRYGAEPVRNAKINGQVAQFVKRLGFIEAPAVAAFYVGRDDAFYTRKLHEFGLALNDAEKLRTEWVTGRQVTVRPGSQSLTDTNRAAGEQARQELFGQTGGAVYDA